MPRPPKPVGTALGHAIRSARGDAGQQDLAAVLGVSPLTLSRLERGKHEPSLATALKLAKWLGWSVEQVVEAAGQPAPDPDGLA